MLLKHKLNEARLLSHLLFSVSDISIHGTKTYFIYCLKLKLKSNDQLMIPDHISWFQIVSYYFVYIYDNLHLNHSKTFGLEFKLLERWPQR